MSDINIDPKLEEAIKKIVGSMTEEQKAKARACNSPEELNAFLMEEAHKIPEDELENVAGGSAADVVIAFPRLMVDVGGKVKEEVVGSSIAVYTWVKNLF